MSREVDQRVVEMEFDNKQFEHGAQTSLSTIEKLKKALRFEDSSKGLESIGKAAKNVDVSGLSAGIETAKSKFSALEIAGVTALVNITNSAVNAGKNLVSSLSIDQVKSGWDKYAQKTSAVQTIMAATAKDFTDTGEQMEYVNDQLEKLNWFTDETSYNFVDMVGNIGKFTSNNIALDKSVTAMQGIATWAALSGANAGEASRAMYNLSQAISTGSVKLIDWKSIENANMSTFEFKQTAIDAAVAVGTLKEKSDGLYETLKGHEVTATKFTESLSDAWFTSDVLLTTLDQYGGFTDVLYEATEAMEDQFDTTSELLKAIDEYKEGQLDIQEIGKNTGLSAKQVTEWFDKLSDSTYDLGRRAFVAGQEARTFQDAIESTKDAVSTGWMDTFELIFGDYLEAKKLWTDVTEELFNVFAAPVADRNHFLKKVLGEQSVINSHEWMEIWKNDLEESEELQEILIQTARNHGIAIDDLLEQYGSFDKSLENNWLTLDLLEEAFGAVLDPVNELGDTTGEVTQNLEELKAVADRVIHGDFGNGADRVKQLTEAGYDFSAVQSIVNNKLLGTELNLENLSDAQLKSVGYTDEQIETLNRLKQQAEETGTPLNKLIEDIRKPSGRTLLLESLANAYYGLKNIIVAVKDAWANTFPPATTEQVYDLLTRVHQLTAAFKEFMGQNGSKIQRTFGGLFSVIHAIITTLKTIGSAGLNLIGKLLGDVNFNVLDITANMGDALTAFSQWIESIDGISKAKKVFVDFYNVLQQRLKLPTIDELKKNLKELPGVLSNFKMEFVNSLPGLVGNVTGVFQNLKDMFHELIENLLSIDRIDLDSIVSVFSDFSAKASSSFANAGDSASGFQQKLQSISGTLSGWASTLGINLDTIKEKFDKVTQVFSDFLSNIHWENLIVIAAGFGMIKVALEGFKTINHITSVLTPIQELFKSLSSAIGSYKKDVEMVSKSMAFENFAIGVAILVGSLIALTCIDTDKLQEATITLIGIIALYGTLTAALVEANKLGMLKGFNEVGEGMVMMAGSIAVLVAVLFAMERLDANKVGGNILHIVELMSIMLVFSGLMGKYGSKSLKGAGATIAFAVALKIMVSALEDLNNMDIQHLDATLMLLAAAVGSLAVIALVSKGISWKNGAGALALVIGLKVLVNAINDIANLDMMKVYKNIDAFILVFGSLFSLVLMTKLFGKNATATAGASVLMLAVGLKIMVSAIKSIGELDPGTALKGMAFCYGMLGFIGAYLAMTRLIKGAENDSLKTGGSLLMMAGAILIMAAAIKLLSTIDEGDLGRATAAVAVLEALFGGLIFAMSKVNMEQGKVDIAPMIALIAGIGVLMIGLGALSMIEPDRLLTTAGSLTMVITAFAGAIAATKFANNKALVSLIVMAGAVAALATILNEMSKLEVQNALPNAVGLSVLLLAMSGACVLLGIAGKFAATALPGVEMFATLVVGLGILIATIGMIDSAMDGKLDSFLDHTLPLLSKIGYGIGDFVGSIISGLGAGLTSGLPEIGDNVSQFLDKIQTSDATLKGVENFAAAVAIISGLSIATAFSGLITDAVSLADSFINIGGFITGAQMDPMANLTTLAEGIAAFAEKFGNVDVSKLETASTCMQALSSLENSLPRQGGILQAWIGEVDLENFSTGLGKLGEALVNYSNAVSADGAINVQAIEDSAKAAGALSKLESSLPPHGGVLQAWLGDNTLGRFGTQLGVFGAMLVHYSEVVSKMGPVGVAAVLMSAKAAEALSKLESSLPPHDGVLQTWLGDSTLSSFGEGLSKFGTALVEYSSIVSADGAINQNAIQASADAAGIMSALEAGLPDTGGTLQKWFVGSNDLSSFGNNLSAFGEALAGYSKIAANINTGAIEDSAAAAKSLASITDGMDKIGGLSSWTEGTTSLDAFGSTLYTFGTDLKQFSDKVDGVNPDKIIAVSVAIGTIIDAAKQAKGVDTSNLSNIANSLSDSLNSASETDTSAFSSMGTKFADGLASGFKSKSADAGKAGETLVVAIIAGITSKSSEFGTAAKEGLNAYKNEFKNNQSSVMSYGKTIGSAALTGVELYESDFEDVGEDCARGFAIGLRNHKYLAVIAAYAVGSAALAAAKAAVDSNSPAKKFIKLGADSDRGLAIGFDRFAHLVNRSAYSVGEGSIDAMQNAVSKIGGILDGTLEMDPTIRPVVDLSNVYSGVDEINGMMSRQQYAAGSVAFKSISMTKPLEAAAEISARTASIQNGKYESSRELIKAINNLEVPSGGDTYNIDGITYDDGSNIATAVKSIIHAALLERRS